MVGKWASSLSRYINIPELQKGGPALWPDKMGILTLEPLTANAKLHTLRHVRPRSDWAVFDGTLSTARMTQSSASTTDSHAYAAVVVRSTNIALKTNNYCLPYIWVSKLWHASCYVVYQSSADILAYPLQYKNQDYFDLTDQHAKAHFQLRLLNIVDSRMRSLSEAQAKTVLNVCTQFRLGVGDLVSEDLSDDEDSEDDLPEAKRWRQMAPSSVQDLSDDEDSEDDLPEAKRWRQTAPSSVHSKS
ncbi:hypothetical protein BT96DRAFT_985628 [Gymnopus androsaceus JB14]|uniref:Uncharacterized protein n=1 Tax=Gymnopus androsaceus JB14 TaxID=1447944 RepID=A0A6A4IDV9_9AGAR|nr:hypothetical protein BT96DRAFT_985628 [Gymnopus androsaceus JB14]